MFLSIKTNIAALHFNFEIGKSMINGIARETCEVLLLCYNQQKYHNLIKPYG